jgi:stage II sporulation protein D
MGARRRGPVLAAVVAAAIAGCAPRTAPPGEPPLTGSPDPGVVLRVAIVGRASTVTLGATGAWQLLDGEGERSLVSGSGSDQWRVELASGGAFGLRAMGAAGGALTHVRAGPLVARPSGGALLTVGGRAYRGELAVVATDTGLLVINRVPLEEYLRGVVPVEMGPRTERERAALEAQAVASRTFALRRRNASTAAGAYDLVATILAQAYGGVSSENDLASEAVAVTAGMILEYEGRPIEAVYSSTCGGSTASASEVWRSSDVPYLRAVSDRIPGSDDYYCSSSPRFSWRRDFDVAALAATITKHLPGYAAVPAGGIGTVRAVAVEESTPSGRVGQLSVTTDAGVYHVRGNDVRYVLRDANGGILPSTYFSLKGRRTAAGALSGVTVEGRGNGHGIGMCQWGAIGRARAGQGVRQILAVYYPGAILALAG